MFSKLILGFIVVILVISSCQLMTNYIYTRNMEREITNNASEKFNNTVNKFEQYFSEIESKLLKDFYLEFSSYLKSPKYLDDKDQVMISKLKKYLVNHSYLQDFVVLIDKFDYVLTTEGTYYKKDFFDIFNKNQSYTERFWMGEMKKDFTYKVYPADEFKIYTGIQEYKGRYSMPIALKNNRNSVYILIAFIDIKTFSNDLVPAFMEDFDIYSANGELIFPEKDRANPAISGEIAGRDDIPAFLKLKNGYIFTKKSARNSLVYCKYYPNTAVVRQINETNRLFMSIIILSVMISLALSVYIVRKFNNPVKQIYRLIRESLDVSGKGGDIIDLVSIKEGVAGIIDKNTTYLKDIKEKDSMLENYFYQARLKNILLQAGEPRENSSGSDNYAVILFKIHYRKVYYENISKDISEGSVNLKELIQLYLCEQFDSAITFQTEDNQIVSIANIKKGVETIEDAIGRTVRKLMSEDEYVYFSIACSDIYESSSDLHSAYERVVEIMRYRKLIDKTQIITERALENKPDVFYFPENQQKQFSNLMINAKKEECIQLIDKVFEYNLKKEANEYCMHLLYVQVIDCCHNVLLYLSDGIPRDLPTNNEYYFLRQCSSLEDYRNRYAGIISECIGYIGNNHKRSDYIVDYVKKYIHENYSKEITVDLLADSLKITRAYLSWYFKKKTGVNLSDYLNNVRMTKACELLQNSLLKVKDIAPEVGIYSVNTFIRLFKQHTGKTPNDYRKSNL